MAYENDVRALIVAKYRNVSAFAREKGYSYSALSYQLVSKNYTVAMIKKLVVDLEIDKAKIWDIFFA